MRSFTTADNQSFFHPPVSQVNPFQKTRNSIFLLLLCLISAVGFSQTAPSSFVAGTATASTLPFSWTAGSGGNDYVIVRNTSATITDLSSGTPYSLNQVLANGTVVGIVTSPTVTFTDNNSLAPGIQYFYKIFNHITTGDLYSAGLTGTMTTVALAAQPTTNPTGLAFSNVAGTSLTLSWNAVGTPAGSGTDRIVIVSLNSVSVIAPADGTTYTPNTIYGTGGVGETTGAGNFVVYKGTGTSVNITGLAANTQYKFSVVAFNGSGGTENYLGAGANSTKFTSPRITNVAFSTPAANTPIPIGTATVTITVDDDQGLTTTLTSGTVGGYTLAGLARTNATTYTATISVVNGGTDIPAGTDIPVANLVLNNGNSASPAYAQAISQPNDPLDANRPTVVSSNLLTPATSPTNAPGNTLTFRVIFSESVTGVAAGNFTATLGGGVTSTAITSVSGSGTTYDVIVPGIGGTPSAGTARLDVGLTPSVTDAAGNALTGTFTTGQSYTVDRVAPTVSVGSPSVANANSAASVTFAVTYTGGSTFNLTNANITLNGTPTATIGITNGTTATPTVTLTNLTGGGNLGITVAAGTASDAAGNQNAVSSPSATVFVDNIPPATPSIPDLQNGSDLGILNNDNLTSDNTPTFDVTGTAGIKLELLEGTTVLNTIAAGSVTGGADAMTSTALTQGNHLISARSTDLAGNTATSTALSVDIDTQAPSVSSITPVQTPSRGFIPKTGTITATTGGTGVTGVGTAFLTELFVGAVILDATGATTIGTVSVIHDDFSLDLTGNASNAITTANYSISLFFTVAFSEVMNSSTITTADFTKTGTAGGSATPLSVGPVTAGTSSQNFRVSVAASGNGTWRLDKTNSPYADLAGNAPVATFTTGTVATIDNLAPAFSAQTPATNAFVNTAKAGYTITEANGPLTSGSITWTRTSGTSDAGSPHTIPLAAAELTSGVHAYATLTNDTISLKNGAVYTVSYTGTDPAGNVATTVTSTGVTYDNAPPTAFNTGAVASTGGTVVSGYWNSTNTSLTVVVPLLLADALTNGSVQIQWAKSSAPLVFTSITGSGISTITGPQVTALTKTVTVAALTDLETAAFLAAEGQTITIRAIITDAAGNATTGANSGNTFVIDQTNGAPSVPDLDPLDDTGLNTDNITKNTTGLTFTGTAEIGATVQLRNNTTNIGGATAVADGSGNWSITVSLAAGANQPINARQTDVAGNPQSAAGTSLNVTVDTAVPTITLTTPVTGSHVNHKKVSYTLSEAISSGSITWTRTSGSADPGSPRIQALAGTELNTGAHNNITLTNSPGLVDGAVYQVTFNVSDVATNPAVAVVNTAVKYDITPPSILSASFNASFLPSNDPGFTVCTSTSIGNNSSGSSNAEYVHLTLSEPLNLADGALITVLNPSGPGFTSSAGGFSVTCGARGSSVYHSGNIIHLKSSADGDWKASGPTTTFAFVSGGTNVLDSAGNEMLSNPNVSFIAQPPTIESSMVLDPNGTGFEIITFTVDQALTTSTAANAVTGITVDADGAGPGAAVSRPGTYSLTGNTITITSPGPDGLWTSATTVSYSSGTGNLTTTVAVASFGPEPILLGPVSITSSPDNANPAMAKQGDHIVLTFTANSTLSATPTVTIAGKTVAVTGSNPYTASLLTDGTVPEVPAPVVFSIVADQSATGRSTTVGKTTDGTTVTFDKTAPAAPSLPDLLTAQDTGPNTTDNITSTNTNINFSGTAEAGSTVTLYKASPKTQIGPSALATGGVWTIIVPSMSDGTYSITAETTDPAGNVSPPSSALSLTIDNTTPVVQSITIVTPPSLNGWSTTNGTTASSVTFRITFDEDVYGLDFSGGGGGGTGNLKTQTTGSVSISGFTGAAATTSKSVDVTVNNVTGTGQLRVDFLDRVAVKNLVDLEIGTQGAQDPDFTTSFTANQYYTIVLPQPTASVPSFNAPGITSTAITVNWNHAVAPAQQATDYLIRLRKSTATFATLTDGVVGGAANSDGADYTDSNFGDNLLAAYVTFPTSSYQFTNLTSGSDYVVQVIPLTKSPNATSVDNWDYKFTAPLTSGTLTTPSAPNSTVSLVSSAATIPSTATALSLAVAPQVNAVQNFVFTIQDDGAAFASDNSDFKFSTLIIKDGSTASTVTDWTQAIASAELSDGTTTISVTNTAVSTAPNSITFPINPATLGLILDNTGSNPTLSAKTYTLRITLKPSLGGTLPVNIDGKNFVFKIDNSSFSYSNTGQTSSTLALAGAGSSAETPATNNVVDVQATKLSFTGTGAVQPSTPIGVASAFPAAPVVVALDPNNNRDTGFGQSATIDNNAVAPNLAPSITTQSFASGLLTLTGLKLNAAGTNVIRVQSAGVTSVSSVSVTAVISNKTTIAAVIGGEPVSFSSLTTALTGAAAPQVNAVSNFDFSVSDDVGADAALFTDNDGLPTLINSVTIAQGTGNDPIYATDWSLAIAGAELSVFNGTSYISVSPTSVTVGATNIVFSGIPHALATDLGYIADGGSRTYTLKIWLKNPVAASLRDVIDNKDFVFNVNQGNMAIDLTNTNATSIMGTSNTNSGDGNNQVKVTATKLDFTTQPNNSQYDVAVTPFFPKVRARDVNLNVDQGYTGTPTVTTLANGAITYPILALSENLTNTLGIITFDSLTTDGDPKFTIRSTGGGVSGDQTKLTVTGGTNDLGAAVTAVTSNFFTLTYSSSSDIIKDASFASANTYASGNGYAENMLYKDYQASTFTANTDGLALERFLLRDGGGSSDTDGSPTTLKDITLRISNWQYLHTVALYSGASKIGEMLTTSVTNATDSTADLKFSALAAFQANDNSNQALTVYATFNQTGITDNKIIQIRVNGATPGLVSSSFTTGGTVNTFATLALNENKIEVKATSLDFTTIPGGLPAFSASLSVPISPQVVVSARDLFANLDLDYNGTITISTTPSVGFHTLNNPTGSFAGGIKTYPAGFQFDIGNGNVQLTISGSAGSSSVASGNDDAAAIPASAGTSNTINVIASFDSRIAADATFTHLTDIDYVNHQEATDINLTTPNTSFEITRFILHDGDPAKPYNPSGILALKDLDGAPTVLQDFDVELYTTASLLPIRRIAIYANGVEVAGTDKAPAALVAGKSTTSFTGVNITAPDAAEGTAGANSGSITISIRVSFLSNAAAILDNDPITIRISSAANGTGSKFLTTAGYIAGVNNGLQTPNGVNKIEVTATKFDFTGSQDDYAGINQTYPLPSSGTGYEVLAHDQFDILDTDFDFTASPATSTVSVTASAGAFPYSGNFRFSAGKMYLDNLEYANTGDGTLTVTSTTNAALTSNVNQPSAVPPNVADKCETIRVVNTTAGINTTGVTGAINLKGGTNNVVIFGVTFSASNPDTPNGQPKLKQFTFSFNKPFRTGLTNATLKNFRVYESLNGAYVSGTTPIVTSKGGTVTEGKTSALATNSRDLVTVTFDNLHYHDLANNSYTFYLMCDVDATASNATPALQPSLLSGGYHAADYSNIQVTQGSVFAGVNGTSYTFASTKPPKLVRSDPANGQLNVNPAQSTLQLTFDVPVWTLDSKAYLYDSANNYVADLNATNGIKSLGQGVTGGQNSPTPPLTFTIPPGKLAANKVYYVLINKGVRDVQDSTKNRGIMDDQFNLYGGITYSGGLRFKTANPSPPKMLSTDKTKYSISASSGTINASFDQRGKAYFLVTNSGAAAPTKAQILAGVNYGSATAYGKGTIDIKLVNTLQYGSFKAITPLAASPAQYAVWMFAENDALPTPFATNFPYLSSASSFAQNSTLSATPTFTIDYAAVSGLYLNSPDFQICSGSFVTLADPIIIEEGSSNDFYNANLQSFNILLPQGYTFDRNTLPVVDLVGSFTGSATVIFANNTLLKVSFTNTDVSNIDKIIITNLRVTGESGLATSFLTRLGGNAIPSLLDDTPVASLSVTDADPETFTNGYTTFNKSSFAQIGINNVVTVIPDNFNDPALPNSPNSAQLISTIKGDYGPVEFTGSGVSNEVLSLKGVTLNTFFDITMTHTNMNGCISTTTQQYEVYDHNTAIPGLPTQQGIINTSFPAFAPSFYPGDSVKFDGVSGYQLDTLIAKVPVRFVAGGSQIIYNSPVWVNLISKIPQALQGIRPPNPWDGTHYDYALDYKFILNDSTIAGSPLPRQAYNNFIRKTTSGNRPFWTGGSMGIIEFIGRYRNVADTSVLIPLTQEVDIFLPPVPVVEVAAAEISGYDPADLRRNATDAQLWPTGTPILCENGVDVLVTGYPRAVQGLSTGSFDIVDAFDPTDTLYSSHSPAKRFGGFTDNLNGTATLQPGLLKNSAGKKANDYKDIRIVYKYHQTISPLDSVGSLLIRISPNPRAAFKAYSVMPKDTVTIKNVKANALEDGRPWRNWATRTDGFCADSWLYFVNTSEFRYPYAPFALVPGYAPKTAATWAFTGGTNVINTSASSLLNLSAKDTVFNKYTAFGAYTVTFDVKSQFNCPSQVFSDTIHVGAIPQQQFTMTGISNLTPISVADATTVSSNTVAGSGNSTLSTVLPPSYPNNNGSFWYYGDLNPTVRLKVQLDSALKLLTPRYTAYAKFVDSVYHKYKTPGHYDIYLKSRTDISDGMASHGVRPGCERLFSRHVIIVPGLDSTKVKTEVTDNFGSKSKLKQWQTSDSTRAKSSWVRGLANKATIKSLPTDSVWVTGLTTNYAAGENSYLYSPAYDIHKLKRPMVSFDSWLSINQSNNVNDGVDLEFSTDTLNIADSTKVWYRLGTNNDGTNWFNKAGLASSPGDQRRRSDDLVSGDFGWGKEDTKFSPSLHTLSPDLPTYPGARSRVIFRFALSSIASTGDQGMAIDNFRIGERTRVILVENFSNLGGTNAKEKEESDYLKSNFSGGAAVGTDFVKLVYHVGFPQNDPFNLDNQADPSGRALYYGVTQTPYTRMDGHDGSDFKLVANNYLTQWGTKGYDDRTLLLAKAKLKFIEADKGTDGAYKVKVKVSAISTLPTSTILHVVLAERLVSKDSLSSVGTPSQQDLIKTGENSFEYVVKKMLPSASGSKFTAPLDNDITTTSIDSVFTFPPDPDEFIWTPDLTRLYAKNSRNLVVIAFLQDEETKEVHQAIMSPLLPHPSTITGLENPLSFEDIQIYPNPADQTLNIVFPNRLERDVPVRMFDQVGSMTHNLKAAKGEQSIELHTGGVSTGLYILQLDLGDGKISRAKIIINHRD